MNFYDVAFEEEGEIGQQYNMMPISKSSENKNKKLKQKGIWKRQKILTEQSARTAIKIKLEAKKTTDQLNIKIKHSKKVRSKKIL